jgi:hypothetical protein
LVVPGESLKRKRIVRTAEVTIETEESIVLFGSGDQRSCSMWCLSCRRRVRMITPEQAAQFAGVSLRTIYRWTDSGMLHFTEASNPMLLCLPSLRAAANEPGTDPKSPGRVT